MQAFSPPEFTAYKVSKGTGEGWKRASRLYDLAQPKAALTEAQSEANRANVEGQ